MKQYMKLGLLPFFFAILLMVASGCSLQASSEEVAQAKKDFIEIVDQVNVEAPNGIKVLTDVRDMYKKGEVKRTKVQNTISNGMGINDNIYADVVSAHIPSELEPFRDRLMKALDKRKEGYQALFDAFDKNDPSKEPAADAKIAESIEDLRKIQKDIDPFRK
ncbi:hypothetical protein ACQCN2_00385 [Brevibacillus ginsengisoli]|uniref:hypothetical protein n=1 Tax=Brevibacillus ginsengisoli TaxID=363854 RepID=UPI003CEDBCA2